MPSKQQYDDRFGRLGDFIHSVRKARGMSQAAAAVGADINLLTFRDIELKRAHTFRLDTLERILKWAGVNKAHLVLEVDGETIFIEDIHTSDPPVSGAEK